METQKLTIVQKLEQTPTAQIAALPEVADRFKKLYQLMHRANPEAGQIMYETQKFHFAKLIQDKPDLQSCTKLSLYGCFLDASVNGLSFDPAAKQLYVVAFSTNVGTKQVPKWEKRAQLMVSGIGELSMRVRQGQVRYADNPVLVYEGDEFAYGTKENKFFISHVAAIPRKTDNIIAAYIRLERNDGTSDYKVMSIEEIEKLRKFSKDPNSKAWTDGLPGMVQAKVIKHAFRTYPKVQMGDFTQLASQVVDEQANAAPGIDYGLDIPAHAPVQAIAEAPVTAAPASNGHAHPQPEYAEVSEDEFASRATTQAPVTVNHDDDEF